MFLGVDLGGSGTRAALVGADGELLAAGKGGPSGHLGGASGRRLLGRALDAALASIGPLLHPTGAVVIHAGTTAMSVPGRKDSLFVEFSRRFPNAEVHISNDALIALWGALAGREGVAVLAGTGSIALARSADGREARSGGWGYLLGDEGGAYWLGRQAIAAYLKWLEGREARGRLIELLETAISPTPQSVPEVIAWLSASASHVARLASLAPLVSAAADAGDPQALHIVARAAHALAELAAGAAGQLWPEPTRANLPVVRCGGVWAAGRVLEQPFCTALAKQLPQAWVAAPLLPPVAGAVLLAMGAAQKPVAQHMIERLAKIR